MATKISVLIEYTVNLIAIENNMMQTLSFFVNLHHAIEFLSKKLRADV